MGIRRRSASDTILKRHTEITVRLYVRLFTVPYFSARLLWLSALQHGQPSWFDMLQGTWALGTVPCPLGTFDTHPQARLGTFKIKTAANNARCLILVAFKEKKRGTVNSLTVCQFWHLSYNPDVQHIRSALRNQVSYGTVLNWTLLLPVWKVFTSTWNQIYASDTSENPLQSCLVCVSFNPQSCTENLFFSKRLLILLHYFIIFGSKQCSKEHKQKRWKTRRRQAGEIGFVYQNNKRNESVTLAGK